MSHDELYVLARGVLLDALDALGPHRGARAGNARTRKPCTSETYKRARKPRHRSCKTLASAIAKVESIDVLTLVDRGLGSGVEGRGLLVARPPSLASRARRRA